MEDRNRPQNPSRRTLVATLRGLDYSPARAAAEQRRVRYLVAAVRARSVTEAAAVASLRGAA